MSVSGRRWVVSSLHSHLHLVLGHGPGPGLVLAQLQGGAPDSSQGRREAVPGERAQTRAGR